MLTLKVPVIVEGKYDKSRLAQVVDGTILTTEGFGIFKNHEKRALIQKLGENGIIVLCDSDGGGKVIRSHLQGILPKGKVYNLYIPQIPGVEKRKRHTGGSKAGFLGVEGIDNRTLEELFERLASAHPEIVSDEEKDSLGDPVTTGDMYALGLTGGQDSAKRRDLVCRTLGLPQGMNANAFRSAIDLLYNRETFLALCADLWQT